MNRDQMKTIGVVVLLVIGVPAALFYAFRGTGGSTNLQPTDSGTSTTAVQSVFEKIDLDIDELVKSIKEVGFDYTRRKSARDPMVPLAGGSKISRPSGDVLAGLEGSDADKTRVLIYEANRKEVTGILWDEENPLAVIDDEIVHVNYAFESGIRVTKIGPTEVILVVTIGNEEIEVPRELKEQ